MDRHLHIHVVGDTKRGVDGCRGRSPVFMELQPDGAGLDLLRKRGGETRVAFAEKTQVHGKCLSRFEHAMDVPGSRRARRGGCSGCGTRASSDHGRHARTQRLRDGIFGNFKSARLHHDDGVFAACNDNVEQTFLLLVHGGVCNQPAFEQPDANRCNRISER